ncbi:MAG: hypothetical protein DRQ41_01100 [Gammaproteobacteria bacterium]|nr:MAG: hypothetical protein DRQ41_01100 [Gammaproteobacteria bacterium]
MKTVLITFFLLCVIASNYANGSDGRSCELPSSEIITIGCTKKCSSSYTTAIKEAARQLKYRVTFWTLKGNKNPDYNLSRVDGIISPGGHDIDPKYYTKPIPFFSKEDKMTIKQRFRKYGKSSVSGRIRDAFEYDLFNHYLTNNDYVNTPFIGICYGMQMLAVVVGIPLYVHIPADIGIPARRKIHDKITLNGQSSLMPFINSRFFTGYKNHHQAVDIKYFKEHRKQFTDVSITGTSNKGKIAEVLELHNRPAIGVQFHPERSTEKTKSAIFSHFLINACLKKGIQPETITKKRIAEQKKSWQDSFQKYPSIQQMRFPKGFIVKTTFFLGSETLKETKKATTVPIVGYLDTKESRFYMSKWSWKRSLEGHEPNWIWKYRK